jgi:hypothetical protein
MPAEKLEWKDVVSAWHTDESSDVSNVRAPQRYDTIRYEVLESDERARSGTSRLAVKLQLSHSLTCLYFR